MDEREKLTRSYYEPRVRTYTEGHEIHGWEDQASAFRRFEVLVDSVPLEGRTLLDVGCGVGDLYYYLVQMHGLDVSYTGVDLLDSMIDRAKSRHPGGRFVVADIISANPFDPGAFDVVFCSGVFNLRIGDHDRFAHAMLPILAELSRGYLVFNMLHTDSPGRDDRYCYFDPAEVVEWDEIRRLSPRIVAGYQPNDFTIICEKTASI